MSLLRRLWRRQPLLPRPVRAALALAFAAAAVVLFTIQTQTAPAQQTEPPGEQTPPLREGPPEALEEEPGEAKPGGVEPQPEVDPEDAFAPELVAEGRQLFLETCSDCHGEDARGVPGVAPTLHGVGELSADFYLRTGRMPLDDPQDQPTRAESPLTAAQIAALIAYVGSLGGPPIPEVDDEAGNIAQGQRLFTDHCAGCHQVVAQGGITTRGVVPDLQVSKPIDVAEATDIGPYVMPHFRWLTDQEVNSLAAYVEYTQDPVDIGGWGIGHIGPVPEGMVTWLLAMAALLLTIRLIGERTTR